MEQRQSGQPFSCCSPVLPHVVARDGAKMGSFVTRSMVVAAPSGRAGNRKEPYLPASLGGLKQVSALREIARGDSRRGVSPRRRQQS